MVRAGEASGTLGIVLERLADISEKQNKMSRKIQAALAYPILMALIGTGVLFFLLTVIVPNITSIFEEMNQTLPFTTQALIDISNILRQWWWLLAGVIVSIAVLSQTLLKRPTIRLAADRFILRVPVMGNLKQKIAVARFSRTLGSLLENGVTMLTALEIVKNVAGNVVIGQLVEDAAREVGKEYLALVRGSVPFGEQTIEAAIGPQTRADIDAVGLNRVRGKPFPVPEVMKAAKLLLDDEEAR